MKEKFLSLCLILSLCIHESSAQNNRLNTSNTIGWYTGTLNIKLQKKASFEAYYAWRRNNIITEWQQSLARLSLNYQATKSMLFKIGYGWAETFAYGEIPINGFGRTFTEHRLFENVQLSQTEGIVGISHRFGLEQRFVGRYSSAAVKKEDSYPFTNRVRYMLRIQLPLKGRSIKNNTLYAAAFDEVFVGFGKNVTNNIFDQNRIGLLLGYNFNKDFKIEGGYLNQTVQYARQINNRNVFQKNNGIIMSIIYTIEPSFYKN